MYIRPFESKKNFELQFCLEGSKNLYTYGLIILSYSQICPSSLEQIEFKYFPKFGQN